MRPLSGLNQPARPTRFVTRTLFERGPETVEVRGYRDDDESWVVIETYTEADGWTLLDMDRDEFLRFAAKVTQLEADINRGKIEF